MKILVVEDEVPLNEILCSELKRKGMETVSAYDGEEALTEIVKNKFQAIILDIKLPKIDGKQVLVELRNAALNKNTPVIIATNSESLELMNECLKLKINAYFVKTNISLKSIIETVCEAAAKPIRI